MKRSLAHDVPRPIWYKWFRGLIVIRCAQTLFPRTYLVNRLCEILFFLTLTRRSGRLRLFVRAPALALGAR